MESSGNCKYEDIINMPHHVSPRRAHMSAHDRAAQFSPFAALSGYGECISETVRLTDEKAELDEERSSELDKKTAFLIERASERPRITVEYFVADERKQGGRYVLFSGNFKGIDQSCNCMVFADGKKIPAEDIFDIRFDITSEK